MTKFRCVALLGATITLSTAMAVAQNCPGAANSNLINFLGTAGPNNYAVLSLGGSGALVNVNLGSVKGTFANIGVPNTGTFKESAPSFVEGNIIVGSLVNTTGAVGVHGPIIIDDARLAQAVYDANYAAQMFGMLTSTPDVQSQFPANGQITTNLTVTGTPGLNVVNLPSFVLNNGSGILTLTGPLGTAFVINVNGTFNLHSGNIAVAGGVGPLDVVYNITNPSATVTTMVPTTASGILLAPNNSINTMDSTSFTGEIIGAFKKSIVLMSGTAVTNPCPQSILLQ